MHRQNRLMVEISSCRRCEAEFRATETRHAPRPVIHLSATAKVLIAGQAPGARVHKSGIPFDDPSGDRLRSWMGIGRDVFYDRTRLAIAPMAFCFPGYDAKGADLPPPRRCAEIWRAQVMESMPQIELILLIGQHAQGWHLGARRQRTLNETVRRWRDYVDGTPRHLVLPHPSWRNTGWLKKNPWFEDEILPVLRAEISRLCT